MEFLRDRRALISMPGPTVDAGGAGVFPDDSRGRRGCRAEFLVGVGDGGEMTCPPRIGERRALGWRRRA